MSTFQIGQLIFVVSNKSQTVLPGIIQEETVSKNLNGEMVSYKILIGPPNSPRSKIIDLSRVDGEVYGSAEEVKEIMLKRFTDYVDGICQKAQQNAQEWYGGINTNNQSINVGEKLDPATLMNDINNGQPQYVQIHGNQAIPMSPGMPQNYQQARRQVQQNMSDSGNPTQVIQMSDGTLKEVSINVNNPKQG